MMEWFVYIAETQSGHFYTGVSNDVRRRMNKHNSGRGSKFARMHPEFRLVYTSPPMTKSDALRREIQIKGWTKQKKEKLVKEEWH